MWASVNVDIVLRCRPIGDNHCQQHAGGGGSKSVTGELREGTPLLVVKNTLDKQPPCIQAALLPGSPYHS